MQRTDAPSVAAEGRGEPVENQSSESVEKQRALALGLELSKRALAAASLDELFFLLTNDLRILIEFDRALLITHIGDTSELVAASNQPVLEKKFPLVKTLSSMAASLRDVERGVVLSGQADAAALSDEDLPAAAKEELLAYVKESGCAFLVAVPLAHHKKLLGHLLLEFYGSTVPQQIPVVTVLSIAPLFASALAEKWLLQAKPRLWNQVFAARADQETPRTRPISLAISAVAVLVLLCVFFLVPITYTVGGETEVFPHHRHMAFVKIDGLVDRIDIKEGSRVKKGQVLAVLDGRELNHETKSAERRMELLTREMMLLRREAGQDPAKLAESGQIQLKRTSVKEELEYLRWKAGFLTIKAPVSGVVATKEVDSFVGKRFRAGESFCEIAAPGEMWAAIFVPEDKISLVRKGQPTEIYLNSDPARGYASKVEEIAPLAQVVPRVGSVYRVATPFPVGTEQIKVGMKGIGKISTGRMSLFRILKNGILARWNHYAIYF